MELSFGPGPIIRGPDQLDDWQWHITPTPVGLPGSASDANVYDAVITTTVSSGVKTNYRIDVQKSLINQLQSLSFASLTSGVSSVDGVGNVAWVADGTSIISVKVGGIERRLSQDIALSGSATTSTTKNYRIDAGTSLGAHCSAQVDALIAGKTAQGNTPGLNGVQNLWATNNYDTASPAVTRNSSFFGVVLANIAAIGAMNESPDDVRTHPPLLLTPRHIIGANHWQTGGGNGNVGKRVVFLDTAGTIQTRTIVAEWSDPENDDHWIGLLSSTITTCPPLQIMPGGWKSYIKSLDSSVGNSTGTIPVMCKVVHRPDGALDDRVAILEMQLVLSESNDFVTVFNPTTSTRYSWSGPIVGGDSGGAIMAVINNALVLLASFWVASGGYSLEKDSAEMESAMRALASGYDGDNTAYAFTRADLSSFATY